MESNLITVYIIDYNHYIRVWAYAWGRRVGLVPGVGLGLYVGIGRFGVRACVLE